MSDLDDLADIADACAFGTHSLSRTGVTGKKAFAETCGNGHPWTPETTRYRKGTKTRVRICRICDKINRARSYATRIARRNANRIATASEDQP